MRRSQLRISGVAVGVVTALVAAVLLPRVAWAEQKGYASSNHDSSDVVINVAVSIPSNPCLMYSTNSSDRAEDVFVPAGLNDCVSGVYVDNASCSSGKYKFGETAHAGTYSCGR